MDTVDLLIFLVGGLSVAGTVIGAGYKLVQRMEVVVRKIANTVERPLDKDILAQMRLLNGGLSNLSTDVARLKGWNEGFAAAMGRHNWSKDELT